METTLSSVTIGRFQNWLSENGHPRNTVRAYRADLTGLLAVTGETPLSQLGPKTAQYVTANKPTWAPRTTQRKLGTFRTWAKWAGDPTFLADYKAPKIRRSQAHPLPEGMAGVMAMLEACGKSHRRRALVALIGMCGLRMHEALAVRPCHITVDGGNMTIIVRGKGDVTREVPVSAMARPIIDDAIVTANIYDGCTLVELKDRWARELWTKLGQRAALSRGTASHDGRATVATALMNGTGNIRLVQEFLGHASVDTTAVYTGVEMTAMRAGLDGLTVVTTTAAEKVA